MLVRESAHYSSIRTGLVDVFPPLHKCLTARRPALAPPQWKRLGRGRASGHSPHLDGLKQEGEGKEMSPEASSSWMETQEGRVECGGAKSPTNPPRAGSCPRLASFGHVYVHRAKA